MSLCFHMLQSTQIVCSSGVHLVPFFALAISRASLNSGLSREHVCCHVFPPACVFPRGLGNTPVTEIGGSPFPHRGVILDVGGVRELCSLYGDSFYFHGLFLLFLD